MVKSTESESGSGSSTNSRGATDLLILIVVVAGAGVLAYSIRDVTTRPWQPGWLVLVALTVSTAWLTLRIPTTEFSFSISDSFNIAAAVLFGPSAGAITAGLDALVLSSRMSVTRRSLYRISFNIAVSAIAMWAAGLAFVATAGDQPQGDDPLAALRLVGPLVLLGAINYVLNVGFVTMAVALERGLPMFTVWREHFLGLWLTHFGGVLAAVPLVLWQLLQPEPGVLTILVLVVPLPILLYTTFRHSLGRVQDQLNHFGQVNRVYVAVIEALAQAVDTKDQVTSDHIRRVQTEAVRLARALGVASDEQLQAITAAALLHDVGKLSVPEHILNKPGPLTPSEFEVMKKHAPAGADILSLVGFPYPVVPIVRHHHENWDGTGYPDALAGEAIPIGARILSVVDCFDALTSHRPYRPRLDDAAALQIIVERRGRMYDPAVVDAFLQMHETVVDRVKDAPASDAAASRTEKPRPHLASDDAQLAELEVSYELGRTVGVASAGHPLSDRLWHLLRRRTAASTCVVYMYDPAVDALIAVYSDGEQKGDFRETSIPLGDRLSGWVGATRQVVRNSDARLDLDEDRRAASPLRSALAVPIESSGRLIGVLSLYAPQPDAFDDGHRRLTQVAAAAIVDSGGFALRDRV